MRAGSTPLQTRVRLKMVHFDAREVGGAPEGCARCLGCRCEHILNAKSFRDAFVAQSVRGTSAVVCVGGPLRTRVPLEMVHFDGRTVGGAPSAICSAIASTSRL